jgi:hypothetical protein
MTTETNFNATKKLNDSSGTRNKKKDPFKCKEQDLKRTKEFRRTVIKKHFYQGAYKVQSTPLI